MNNRYSIEAFRLLNAVLLFPLPLFVGAGNKAGIDERISVGCIGKLVQKP